jgi:hypothetical protein
LDNCSVKITLVSLISKKIAAAAKETDDWVINARCGIVDTLIPDVGYLITDAR